MCVWAPVGPGHRFCSDVKHSVGVCGGGGADRRPDCRAPRCPPAGPRESKYSTVALAETPLLITTLQLSSALTHKRTIPSRHVAPKISLKQSPSTVPPRQANSSASSQVCVTSSVRIEACKAVPGRTPLHVKRASAVPRTAAFRPKEGPLLLQVRAAGQHSADGAEGHWALITEEQRAVAYTRQSLLPKVRHKAL